MITIGTDIDTEYTFNNGDINLISNYGNLTQSVINRLNTDINFYNIFYAKYGGILWEHMGDMNIPTIHEYIRIEIEDVLKQDPRISSCEVNVTKKNSKSVNVELNLKITNSDNDVGLNLVIDSVNGVSVDTMDNTLNGGI